MNNYYQFQSNASMGNGTNNAFNPNQYIYPQQQQQQQQQHPQPPSQQHQHQQQIQQVQQVQQLHQMSSTPSNQQMFGNSGFPAQQMNPVTSSPSESRSSDPSANLQKRIALLLDINLDLLEQSLRTPKDTQDPQSLYMACMKRIQCNLSYLAVLMDKTKAMSMAGALQIMTPPPDVPHLIPKYDRLRALVEGQE